jgi:hypothetical protein
VYRKAFNKRRKIMREYVFWSLTGLTLLAVVGFAAASISGNKKGRDKRRKISSEMKPAFEYRLFPITENMEAAKSA